MTTNEQLSRLADEVVALSTRTDAMMRIAHAERVAAELRALASTPDDGRPVDGWPFKLVTRSGIPPGQAWVYCNGELSEVIDVANADVEIATPPTARPEVEWQDGSQRRAAFIAGYKQGAADYSGSAIDAEALDEAASDMADHVGYLRSAGDVDAEQDGREFDRNRFPDSKFNDWLDGVIADGGYTVYDAINDIPSAWEGWSAAMLCVVDDDSTDYECPDCGKLNYKPLGCANCGYEPPPVPRREGIAEQAKAEGDASVFRRAIANKDWVGPAAHFRAEEEVIQTRILRALIKQHDAESSAPKPAGGDAVGEVRGGRLVWNREYSAGDDWLPDGTKIYAQPQAVAVTDEMVERFCFACWSTWSKPALRTDTDRARAREWLLAALAPGGEKS